MMKKNMAKTAAMLAAVCILFSGCGGSNKYGDYAAAFQKVTANGGMNADFDVSLEMDGATAVSDGNFKLDTSQGNNLLYYEMNVDGASITQFSDGEYLYTDSDGQKTKYALDSKPSGSADREEAGQKDSSGTFDAAAFLSEFSSFMEAGKIKELGLLSPVERAAVTDVSEKDGVYTLSFSDKLVQKYLNIMIENQTKQAEGETLRIDEMKDFTYKAEVSKDIVTAVEYSGSMGVTVPASLMSSGEEADYDLKFDIKITFVDPGEAVSVEIPATDGYQEVQ